MLIIRDISNKSEKRTNNLMFILMIIIISSFFLRDGLGVNIPIILFVFLYSFGFIIFKRKELVQFFIFLIPLSNGPLLYYLNFIFAILFLMKNIKNIKNNKAIMIGLCLAFWELLHLLPNLFLGYNDSIIKLLGFFLALMVTTIVISNEEIKNNYISIIYSWTIGFGSFCSILLFKYIYNFGLNNFTTIVKRFGWIPSSLSSSATSLLMNPNTLGKLSILTVFCLLTVLKYEKKHSFKMIIMIIYLTLLGFLSGSRSFLLIFIILYIIYMFDMLLNIKQHKKMFISFIIITILVFIFSINYMESTLDMFTMRFEAEDISGSRFKIYKEYLGIISKSPYIIFGSGMQNYNVKYNLAMSSHNLFIEILSIWGIIGLVIVFLWFVFLYKSLNLKKSNYNKTILHYLPLLGLFLYAQTGQFFISYYHTLPTLILAFINIKYVNNKIIENNKHMNEIEKKNYDEKVEV